MKRYTYSELCDRSAGTILYSAIAAKNAAEKAMDTEMEKLGYKAPEKTENPRWARDVFLYNFRESKGKDMLFDDKGNPVDIDTYGNAPLQDVFVYVPEASQIVRIAEGTGDNLLHEDIEAGYIDYLVYEQYSLEQDMPEEDGGMLLLRTTACEKYDRLFDAVPDILEMAYGKKTTFFPLCEKKA